MQLIAPDERLLPGLADPVLDSQRIFRAMLDAMSRPGRPVAMPVAVQAPRPLNPVTTALCLTLLDLDTPVWVQPEAAWPNVVEHLRFHCGCRLPAEPAQAAFGVIAEPSQMPRMDSFAQGDPEYPEQGATIIVQVEHILLGTGPALTGPGIESSQRADAAELPPWFWPAFLDNSRLFPTGVDVILTTEDALLALPRSVRVEI